MAPSHRPYFHKSRGIYARSSRRPAVQIVTDYEMPADVVTTCGPADQSSRNPKPVDARQNEGGPLIGAGLKAVGGAEP